MDQSSGKTSMFHQAMIRVARAEKIMAESQLQQGADAETLVKLGRKAFSWSEGIVDVFRKENPVNVNKIDCSAGCSWCCRLPVFASAPEIFTIAAHLRESLDEEAYSKVAKRVRKKAEEIADWTMEKRQKDFVCCPLLIDDKCSVYEVRPLVCRGYTSYDKEVCRRKTENQDSAIAIEGFLLQYLVPAYTRLGLQASVESAGITPFDIDLIRGLWRVLDDENLVDKWLAGESVFEDISLPVVIPPELNTL